MVAIAPCQGCTHRDHSRHIERWDPAPVGMIGGRICLCEGGCERENPLGWYFCWKHRMFHLCQEQNEPAGFEFELPERPPEDVRLPLFWRLAQDIRSLIERIKRRV